MPTDTEKRRTHCKNGHEFVPENLVKRSNGSRECKRCKAIRYASMTPEQRARYRGDYTVTWTERPPKPLAERVLTNYVLSDTGCWVWTRTRGKTYGYGHVKSGGRMRRVHRVSWELANGPIPAGLQLDHLGRNPACINPAHLEPVTNEENQRRAAAVHTSCRRGHPYTVENTRCGSGSAKRVCRTCVRETQRRYAARRAAALSALTQPHHGER